MKCLKDAKNCYIHHDKETGFETYCRHYELTQYGGSCPESYEEEQKDKNTCVKKFDASNPTQCEKKCDKDEIEKCLHPKKARKRKV